MSETLLALEAVTALPGPNGEGLTRFHPRAREGYLLAIEEAEQAIRALLAATAPPPDQVGERIVLHIDPPSPQMVPVAVPCRRCGARP